MKSSFGKSDALPSYMSERRGKKVMRLKVAPKKEQGDSK
jgi:hypothetical protein